MTANLFRHIPTCKDEFEFYENFGAIRPVTVQEYRHDLDLFSHWMDTKNVPDDLPVPPEVVVEWLEQLTKDGVKPNTIKRRMSAIRFLHACNSLHSENPMLHPSVKGFFAKAQHIRTIKKLSNRPLQKEPITGEQLKKMVKQCNKKTLTGLRSRALLLVGFFSAMRRSEICHLQWSDIKIEPDHSKMNITIRTSKTDKRSEGQLVRIIGNKKYPPYCPIQTLLNWMEASGITSGYLFRSIHHLYINQPMNPRGYANLIKECCEKTGLDPALYSGHSSRRGMLQTASKKGADLHTLAMHARHQDSRITEHYIGYGISDKNNPTRGLI